MIKKILSFFIASVLLLSVTSCVETNSNSNPDDQKSSLDGYCERDYKATYEEVENSLATIDKYQDYYGEKFILFDTFKNDCEIIYRFHRFASWTSGYDSLEEFYTAPESIDFISWYAEFVFGECSYADEDVNHLYVGDVTRTESLEEDRAAHRSTITFYTVNYRGPEVTDPELLMVETDYSRLDHNKYRYCFVYDENTLCVAYSCFELDDGMLEKFREAIIDAYLPAAE